MVQRLDVYGPIRIGAGTDFELVLEIDEPYLYTVGFDQGYTQQAAAELVPDGWDAVGYLSPGVRGPARREHVFVATGQPLAPVDVQEVIDGTRQIRYIVPAYRTDAFGSTAFTPSPNEVIVLIDDADEAVLAQIDAAAGAQNFSHVEDREFVADGRIRRVYSSRPSQIDPQDDQLEGYSGEVGPALFLIDQLMEDLEGDGVVAEPDWFVSDVNELATGATESSSTPHTANPNSGPQASTDSGAAAVAILDGEFDLDYTNGRLPFSLTRFNAVRRNQDVGIKNNHAHGTLCAGLVGAQKPIEDWGEAGIAPGVPMVPVSVYETTDPIQAKLGDLVDGIRFAVTQGCRVLSISVAGYLPGSDLITIIEWAERRRVVVVSGTGNRIVDDATSPQAGVVLYPAAFPSVLGVGAAMVEVQSGNRVLRRVQAGMFSADETAWESHYGQGLDVVAQGLEVTSTDISGPNGASLTDVWGSFSGTSASTPIVAGFAARIASSTNLTASQIREEIKKSALRLEPYFDPDDAMPQWVGEVGCGYIDRDVIQGWRPPPDPVESTTEGETMPEVLGAVPCGPGRQIAEVATEMGLPEDLVGMFSNSLRPLGEFLIALGSGEEPCSRIAIEFWRDPYRIARIVGLPWHAAVLLGRGEWEAVYEAVDAENHRNRTNTAGPVWVRAR